MNEKEAIERLAKFHAKWALARGVDAGASEASHIGWLLSASHAYLDLLAGNVRAFVRPDFCYLLDRVVENNIHDAIILTHATIAALGVEKCGGKAAPTKRPTCCVCGTCDEQSQIRTFPGTGYAAAGWYCTAHMPGHHNAGAPQQGHTMKPGAQPIRECPMCGGYGWLNPNTATAHQCPQCGGVGATQTSGIPHRHRQRMVATTTHPFHHLYGTEDRAWEGHHQTMRSRCTICGEPGDLDEDTL